MTPLTPRGSDTVGANDAAMYGSPFDGVRNMFAGQVSTGIKTKDAFDKTKKIKIEKL